MRVFLSALLASCSLGLAVQAQDVEARARQLESNGDSLGARTLLQDAVRQAPNDVERLTVFAEFLDRYNDPEARPTYEKLLGLLAQSGAREKRVAVARRLVVLDLIADDHAAAVRHLEAYRAAGGSDFPPTATVPQSSSGDGTPTIAIPGPLASFARMAALNPELRSEDLLPALARNVVTNGYQASSSNEALEQTEYLKLVVRYLSQARELEKLAGPSKTIRIDTCDSPQTADLLRVIGFRMRGGCGSDVVLETVNATRAFLTIDSGFPVAELEQALRTNRPFVDDFQPAQAAVLFGPDYWLSSREKQTSGDFIDAFLADPSLCRLYLGMSKLDRETAAELRKAVPVQRLKAFAHVLDFFGGMFQIRNGKAIVPGGAKSAAGWADLVGAPPDKGAAFFERLIARDDGWIASYFDALSRIGGPVQDYLTEPARMKRFYLAIRGKVTSPGPARPVFRSNTDLMLLTTRLRLEPNGQPHIPGSIEVWKNLFVNHPHGKYDAKLSKLAEAWKEPDDVLEALFALCRKAVENEPLKIFMALSDLNRGRSTPLEAATVDRLAREYRAYGAQYPIFSEVPTLSDKTIIDYMDAAAEVSRIRSQSLRADTAGTMQALVGLWQIFCRNGAISLSYADTALSGIARNFARLTNEDDLFDRGIASVKVLLAATHTPDGMSPQDRFMDLLAGSASSSDVEAHRQVIQEMMRLFEAQRLISLKTIMDVAGHLEELAQGATLNSSLINRLDSRISEIQLPRAGLSTVEKNALSFGYWTERHIEQERKLKFRSEIEKAGTDAAKLRGVRGSLAPILRDTLVGFNYIHYAPPGAQVLRTNPLFVRGHDFLGVQGSNQTWRTTEVFGTGWPSSAGGRLVGSLSGLPYALAEAEQNFLIPSREQALIWGDLVPQMILTAKIPRWWNVTPAEMHWVALQIHYAESVLAEGVLDPGRRKAVLEILARQAPPARVEKVGELLAQGKVGTALDNVTTSEKFVLATDLLRETKPASGVLVSEIRRLAAEAPDRVNYKAVSRAFGTPKPTLATSYRPELLNLRTFPTLMGYSSRIMAESWESNLLYYATLADELHLRPSQLNVLIPEWTQQTVETIFATHLEDWPALLRSLRMVGDDVRAKIRKQIAGTQQASLQ